MSSADDDSAFRQPVFPKGSMGNGLPAGSEYRLFREGITIRAASFINKRGFDVLVLSSRPFADGGTAKLFLGCIHRATTQESATKVALKLFVNNMAEAEQQLLDRELRAVRRVRHRYILPYMGTAVFGFNKILVAPYQENGNLLQYIISNRSVDRRPLLIQVAEAVDFLHTQHKIIHGDLKCENVLVADDGRALLADFGLSTVMEKAEGSTRTVTALRQQMTVQFAAPELLFGDPSDETGRPTRRTAQTDVYAFGMLVLQAFTGRPPWPGFSYPAIIRKLCTRELHPRPAHKTPPTGLPDDWWDACVACWAYDPAERPCMGTLLTMLDGGATYAVGLDGASDDKGADADDERHLSDSEEVVKDGVRIAWDTTA